MSFRRAGTRRAVEHSARWILLRRSALQCLSDFAQGLHWKPDAVVIASVSSRHGVELLACLQIGLPCLAEKPLVATRVELDGLRAALGANRDRIPQLSWVATCDICRPVRHLAAALSDARFGAVVRAHLEVGQNLAQWRPARDLASSSTVRNRLRGGWYLIWCMKSTWRAGCSGRYRCRPPLAGMPRCTCRSSLMMCTWRCWSASMAHPVVVSLDYLSQQASATLRYRL